MARIRALHEHCQGVGDWTQTDEPPLDAYADEFSRVDQREFVEQSNVIDGRFVAGCDRLKNQTGAHVMVIHHSGKDEAKGARGSYSLLAAVDVEISVTSDKEIKCTKSRDFVTPRDITYELKSVTIGDDQDGDKVTSCVVEATSEPLKKHSKRKALTGQAKIAFEALDAALQQNGKRYPDSKTYPQGVDIVDVMHWRDECYKRGLTDGESESARRNAFHRVKKSLQNKDLIQIFEDRVWRSQNG